jgi:predicted nucleic acid-binding protein
MIFDTTIWVDYYKGIDNLNTNLLHSSIVNLENIFICPIIVQEVLQGFRIERDYVEAYNTFEALVKLELPSYYVAEKAAQLYRTCRRNGKTIRKANDCIITVYALEFNALLVHNDRDFDVIAETFPLKIYNLA